MQSASIQVWEAALAACFVAYVTACAPADPPAGDNSRPPPLPATQGSPTGGSTGGFAPTSGTGGGAGTRPPPPAGAGQGGASGAAGSSMDAGADAQASAADAGPEPLPFCDDADAGSEDTRGTCIAIGDFRVQHKLGDSDAADNAVKPHLNVINDGDETVDLSELTIRYWFTREGTPSQVFWCDYAQIDCAQVRGAFVAAEGQGADFYLEVSFTGGTLAPGAQTGEVQTRFNKEDWSLYDETDDYSYQAGRSSFADAPKVTLYRRGTLAWGVEPAP